MELLKSTLCGCVDGCEIDLLTVWGTDPMEGHSEWGSESPALDGIAEPHCTAAMQASSDRRILEPAISSPSIVTVLT